MTRRRRRTPLALQAFELAFAVPQVMAHRLDRMARAGAMPGKRDRDESLRMGTEKVAAGLEAWSAAASYGLSLQRAMMREMLRTTSARPASPMAAWSSWMSLCLNATRGLESMSSPFHRRAVANSARLGGRRRRG